MPRLRRTPFTERRSGRVARRRSPIDFLGPGLIAVPTRAASRRRPRRGRIGLRRVSVVDSVGGARNRPLLHPRSSGRGRGASGRPITVVAPSGGIAPAVTGPGTAGGGPAAGAACGRGPGSVASSRRRTGCRTPLVVAAAVVASGCRRSSRPPPGPPGGRAPRRSARWGRSTAAAAGRASSPALLVATPGGRRTVAPGRPRAPRFGRPGGRRAAGAWRARRRPSRRRSWRRARRTVGLLVAVGAGATGGHSGKITQPNGDPGTRRRPPRTGAFFKKSGGDLLSQGDSPQVPSALVGLTSVFGMGTGVTPPL